MQVRQQLAALLGAGLFEDGPARHHDVAAAAVHLQDLERLRDAHQRSHVAHRADVDLAARQERHGAVEIHGEAALDAAEDDAFDARAVAGGVLQAVPSLFTAGALAADHRFAHGVFHTLEEYLDGVADVQALAGARRAEFGNGDSTFGLQADVDDDDVVFDADDGTPYDGAFDGVAAAEALIQKGREFIAKRGVRAGVGRHAV